MFGKSKIKELEGQILELQQELENVRKNEERLRRVSTASDRTIQELMVRTRELEVANQQANGSNHELLRQLEAAQADVRRAVEEKNRAILELDSIRKAEKKAEELKAQLLIAESDLAALIKKAKLATVIVIRTLKNFMDRYEFFRYHSFETPHDAEELRRKTMFPMGGSYSKQQIEEAKKRNVKSEQMGLLPSADEMLQESFAALLRVMQLLNEMGRLVDQELLSIDTLKRTDNYIELVLKKYESAYEGFIKYKASIKFEETVLNAIKQGYAQDNQINLINEKILKIIREIIMLLALIREKTLSNAIGIFFPEFDRLQPGLKSKLDRLFNTIIKDIQAQENLSSKLIELDDKQLKVALDAFGVHLEHKLEADIDAIRRAEKRKE